MTGGIVKDKKALSLPPRDAFKNIDGVLYLLE
jgi:hypothetical protein